MTTVNMSSILRNSITDELREDFRARYIETLREMVEDDLLQLAFFHFGKPIKSELYWIEIKTKISWTNVRPLKRGLRAVGRDDLAKDWEEFETKRNLALLLDASMPKIWKNSNIPRQRRFEYVEAMLKLYRANYALDENTGRSFGKSKGSILEEVMISLKGQIESYFTEPWTKKLVLLLVDAGKLLSQTETRNEEFPSLLPEDAMRSSSEICSRMRRLEEWDKFFSNVEELYNEVYCEHDHSNNAIDVKKIADDAIQTCFFCKRGVK
ncbi:uncharacterized protein LOC114963371 [Acropora millepora]|uniref:uncharacterized protein LOC114963371 n=1 Tax=Acropora millepora TaxID=45264 RepID=UPI001CF45202|nr:uncharacterized protein LOC114963371 [Acropora millepora]